ncbi:MAG: hypothetical protein ACF788_08275 [Novipirellula sp. JB048]
MHRNRYTIRIAGFLIALCASAGVADASIRIVDQLVEPTLLEAGERLHVAVAAKGTANFYLRHDRAEDAPRIPGWSYVGEAASHGFLPSDDFTEPGDYKNPESAHKDNGLLDRDPRRGIFRLDLDTSAWPPGQYRFTILATNRPAKGAYQGDTRDVVVTVVAAGNESAGSPDDGEPRVHLEVNGSRISANRSMAPVYPGRVNALVIRVAGLSGDTAPWRARLIRLQPDGRRTERSARLTSESPEATLDLGLLAVPAEFDFEAGTVYRRACRFELAVIGADGKPAHESTFFHTVDDGRHGDVLRVGDDRRVVHLGWADAKSPRPLDPPVLMRLAPTVLENVDHLTVLLGANWEELSLHRQTPRSIPGLLRVTRETDANPTWESAVEITSKTSRVDLPAADWPQGRYRIELIPKVEGSDDRDGPVLVYRRNAPDTDQVRLSPLAPWAFRRDRSRPELEIRDFREAFERFGTPPNPADWTFRDSQPDGVSLVSLNGDWLAPGVAINPRLVGHYAVFAEAENGHGYVQVGREGLVRSLCGEPCFVAAANMSGQSVSFFPGKLKGTGLKRLRFVPVEAESVAEVTRATSHPPQAIFGVADWCDYFAPPSSHHSAGGRVAADQLDTLLGGHAELGIRHLGWSIGRSWVEYDTQLPQATRFPCVPLETVAGNAAAPYAGRAYVIENHSPLTHVLSERQSHGVAVFPWLAMQRHYGENAYGGIFCSRWFRENPQWRRWSKLGSRSPSTVSYYFPEVRRERIDILCEVAAKSPDGLLIGASRQPPMLLYHPEMVAEYLQRFGVDPQRIDASDEKAYSKWIRWRADFFTQTLRELQERLAALREQTGRALPVAIRIPSKGLFYNMAHGLDVESWCREKLVDEILLCPLEQEDGRGEPHDVLPYVELGRRYGVTVRGGVNGNTFWNSTVILRRTLGLLEAGCDGVELYESNNFCVTSPRRWLVPLLGDPERTKAFLTHSNLDACYPIWSRNAAAGHDNHSFRGKWNVHGVSGSSL